jgi:small-conductance mechanosensitive channel
MQQSARQIVLFGFRFLFEVMTMMDKVKKYFNGSMEPEPRNESREQDTDLGVAARFFNLLGIIGIAVGLVLFPVIGFQVTFILFGILFIGISILFKSQDQILQKLKGIPELKDQPIETAKQGEERNESFL